jgi:heat shock protein HtpX
MMNRVNTVMLLAILTAVLLWAGHALGGHSGLVMALVTTGLMNVGAYWWSDQLILRMYGAQEVTEAQTPEL